MLQQPKAQIWVAHNQDSLCTFPCMQNHQIMICAGLIPAAWAGSAEERSFIMVRCMMPSSMHTVLECCVPHGPTADMNTLNACSCAGMNSSYSECSSPILVLQIKPDGVNRGLVRIKSSLPIKVCPITNVRKLLYPGHGYP